MLEIFAHNRLSRKWEVEVSYLIWLGLRACGVKPLRKHWLWLVGVHWSAVIEGKASVGWRLHIINIFLNAVALARCSCARELKKKENRLMCFSACLDICSENKGISMTGLEDHSL